MFQDDFKVVCLMLFVSYWFVFCVSYVLCFVLNMFCVLCFICFVPCWTTSVAELHVIRTQQQLDRAEQRGGAENKKVAFKNIKNVPHHHSKVALI